jgi:hypothetical protein
MTCPLVHGIYIYYTLPCFRSRSLRFIKSGSQAGLAAFRKNFLNEKGAQPSAGMPPAYLPDVSKMRRRPLPRRRRDIILGPPFPFAGSCRCV